jgi:hypothetical protein
MIDCNGNGISDACDAGCDDCDADGDGCLDGADSAPGNPMVCGDTDADGCDDCRFGTFDPANDGPDIDGDGICIFGDCVPGDDTVWSVPGPAINLRLSAAPGGTELRWDAPADRGAVFLDYDVLRSAVPQDFSFPALCLETDEADRFASDPSVPGSTLLHHYLIRVENDCPASNIGENSAGDSRSALACR